MDAAPRRPLLVLGLLLPQAAAFVPGGAANLPHVRAPHAASSSPSGPLYLHSRAAVADLPRLPGAPVRALDVIAEWKGSPAFEYRVEDDIDKGRKLTAELLDTARVIELTKCMLDEMRRCVRGRLAEYVIALVPRDKSEDIRALVTVARRVRGGLPAVEVLNHVARPNMEWQRNDRTPLIHKLLRWVNGTCPVIVQPWGHREERYYESLGFRLSDDFDPLWAYAGPAVTGHGDAAGQVPGPGGSGAEPQAEQDMQIVALDIAA